MLSQLKKSKTNGSIPIAVCHDRGDCGGTVREQLSVNVKGKKKLKGRGSDGGKKLLSGPENVERAGQWPAKGRLH